MGCRADPFTSIFSNIGKVIPYVAEQNVAISSAVPGSCPPNWLHGKPTTANPRSANCSCKASRPAYCGVSPHLEATFTTRSVLPSSSPRDDGWPARVLTGKSRTLIGGILTVEGGCQLHAGSIALNTTACVDMPWIWYCRRRAHLPRLLARSRLLVQD